MASIVFLLCLLLPQLSSSKDLGFRYENGYCQKRKKPGSNPQYLGECGNQKEKNFNQNSFEDISLKGAYFNSSYFNNFQFKGTDLSHTSFRKAVLLQSQFIKLKAHKMKLLATQIKGTLFEESDLRELKAQGARISRTHFNNCDLQDANFWGAHLLEVDFSKSDLRGADLSTTSILLSNFKGSKYNNKTKLPFSDEEALKKGMLKVEE